MRYIRVAVIATLSCLCLAAQFAASPGHDVLLIGSYRTPMSYGAALAQLGSYYEEQVGRKLAVVFPKIAPDTHYETWHDMWVFFARDGGSLNVTIKRPTDAATEPLAKGWMLQIAGRTGGELPPRFEEKPAMRSVESQLYGSRKDLARALANQPAFHLLETWQHAGLLVSAAPLTRIELTNSGQRGMHRITVTAETAAAARQLANRLSTAVSGPCVCSVYSETAEIEEELHRDAAEKAESVNALAPAAIYGTEMEPQTMEEKLRAEPEMQKRLAAANGWFGIKYRVDKPYSKVKIRWTELTGYSREDGSSTAKRELGSNTAANVRATLQPGSLLTGRTRLGTLSPGAYRITIEGQTAAGGNARIDQRDYWFDGKTFEEL